MPTNMSKTPKNEMYLSVPTRFCISNTWAQEHINKYYEANSPIHATFFTNILSI